MNSPDIPAGFTPIARYGPFIGNVGPLYVKAVGERLIVGLRIDARHTNLRGIAHGGMLVTIADNAMGYVISTHRPEVGMATVNLTTDFLDVVRPGDWLEAHVEVERIGNTLAFASCHLQVGEKRVLRGSGVFALHLPRAADSGGT